MDDLQKAELLDDVLARTQAVVAAVPARSGEAPTPCSQWNVSRLTTHMVGWLRGFGEAVATGSLKGDPDAHRVGDDPAAEFGEAARGLLQAWRDGGAQRPVALTGDSPLPPEFVFQLLVGEYVVHGWDLAVATGQAPTWTDEQATYALEGLRGMLQPEYRGPDKMMGEEVIVADDATPLERLVAFSGRDPHWRP